MNSLKESGTKRGRQSGREVEGEEGWQAWRGAEQTKGEKTDGEKETILDGDCILKIWFIC